MIESVKCTTTSCAMLACCCTHWVVGEYSIPKFLEAKEDIAQRRVRGKELDLPRAVKEYIVICDCSASPLHLQNHGLRTSELLQSLLEPVEIVFQLLESIQNATVWSQRLLLHDLIYRD